MEKFLNCPADFAINKSKAYTIAKSRYRAQSEQGRIDMQQFDGIAGICWQGDHGQTCYARWDELPAPTTN
jgi:hypothetical protein